MTDFDEEKFNEYISSIEIPEDSEEPGYTKTPPRTKKGTRKTETYAHRDDVDYPEPSRARKKRAQEPEAYADPDDVDYPGEPEAPPRPAKKKSVKGSGSSKSAGSAKVQNASGSGKKKSKKKKKKKVKPGPIIICVLLAALAAGGVYAVNRVAALDTIFPGVTIDGNDTGNMTREQAAGMLESAGWEEKISAPLKVTSIGGYSFEVAPKTAGTGIPAAQLAEEAFACGRCEKPLDNFISYVKFLTGAETAAVSSGGRTADRGYVSECVDTAIAAIAESTNVPGYVFDEEKSELQIKKGGGEITLNRDAFINEVALALEEGRSELTYTDLAMPLTAPDFQAIYDGMPHETVDAVFSDDGRFTVIDETIAREFDVSEAQRIWDEAAPAEDIVIPVETTLPAVTGDDLRATLFRDLLGTCTTYYPNSNDARRSNLRLATSKITGTVMYPGDVFSYNETVGERTEEAGFLKAPAYFNGAETEEIGGGACQVSSTLYASTLFAFLETVERECHYFEVNYIQKGTDATVTIPTDGGRAIDFKFKNSRNYPIKLVGSCNNLDSSITFEIWGTLEENDYMPVEFDNSSKGQYASDIKIDKTDPARQGYIIRLEHETYTFDDEVGSGYRTLTWRRVYDEEGNRVFEELTNMKNKAGDHTMDTYYFHEH